MVKTNFTGVNMFNFNVTKWIFGFLSFSIPLIGSIFTDNLALKIFLSCLVLILPFLTEIIVRLIKGYILKRKLYSIFSKKQFEIRAVGMYIHPNFRTSPDDFNSKVQLSEQYLININIIFKLWYSELKIVGFTSINGKRSSTFTSTNIDVWIDSDNSVKIRYIYENEYLVTPEHKTKFISNFSGMCNLHFDNSGNLVDYYYSFDGKNRFSFLKELQIL